MESLIPTFKLKELSRSWLQEDVPSLDIGGAVVGDTKSSAVLLCKSAGILAGKPFFDSVFGEVDCKVEWHFEEGDNLRPICQVAHVSGKSRSILLGERVALNCLARASGVATVTSRFKELVGAVKWRGKIAGTRKTTPGFRLVEKYALMVGGGDPHRYDLSSMVMLKDNHLATFGSNMKEAIQKAKHLSGKYIKIEVECSTRQQALTAAFSNCDIIMLDNFEPNIAKEVAEDLKSKFPHITIEVSGGITEETIQDFCSPSIDVISCGKLTQGYPVVDFSLKFL